MDGSRQQLELSLQNWPHHRAGSQHLSGSYSVDLMITGSVPMFPASLATGPFSLRAGEDSMAVSIGVVLAPNGSLASDVIVSAALVCPSQRMTYIDADKALAAGTDSDLNALAEVSRPVLHT